MYSHFLNWEKEDRQQPSLTLEVLVQPGEESAWTGALLQGPPGNASVQPVLRTPGPSKPCPAPSTGLSSQLVNTCTLREQAEMGLCPWLLVGSLYGQIMGGPLWGKGGLKERLAKGGDTGYNLGPYFRAQF